MRVLRFRCLFMSHRPNQPIPQMQNTLRFFIPVVFVFCSMVIFVQRSNADVLRDICQSASQMPTLLKSYQFSFEVRSNAHIPTFLYDKVDVWQSGSNIKTITTGVHSEGTEIDPILEPLEYAFNGVHYQWFATGTSNLTFSKKCRHPTPYWTQNPLIEPYFWVADLQANWSDIKDIARWETRFKEAKHVGEKIEDGVHFEIVSFPSPQMEVDRVHVYFARDLNYYPLKFFAYIDGMNNGLPVADARVTRYKSLTLTVCHLFFL